MQLNPPSEHETASDKKEKYLLFFAPTSTSKNVSTVAFDISKEKEKEIAEKLSSMCTTDSPILPIDCAPKSSLSSISASFDSKRTNDEAKRALNAEMAKSAKETLECLLRSDATTQSNNIEKMLSIACARSVNMNVVPSKEGNGGFTIEEEEERGGGEMTTRGTTRTRSSEETRIGLILFEEHEECASFAGWNARDSRKTEKLRMERSKERTRFGWRSI